MSPYLNGWGSDMYEYKGYVTNVVDGDTVDVHIDLGFHIGFDDRLRLYGIDTAEIFRPRNEAEKEHGYAARDLVERFCVDKPCIIKTYKDKRGKYGRWLADIIVDGKSLVFELKAAGMAKRENY